MIILKRVFNSSWTCYSSLTMFHPPFQIQYIYLHNRDLGDSSHVRRIIVCNWCWCNNIVDYQY